MLWEAKLWLIETFKISRHEIAFGIKLANTRLVSYCCSILQTYRYALYSFHSSPFPPVFSRAPLSTDAPTRTRRTHQTPHSHTPWAWAQPGRSLERVRAEFQTDRCRSQADAQPKPVAKPTEGVGLAPALKSLPGPCRAIYPECPSFSSFYSGVAWPNCFPVFYTGWFVHCDVVFYEYNAHLLNE